MNALESVVEDPPATPDRECSAAATTESPPQSSPRTGSTSRGCQWVAWVSFITLGALIGPLLGDLHPYGLDTALAAVLLVLLKGLWNGVHAALPWLFSLVTAGLFYLLIPGGGYVLAGTLAGLVSAYLWAKPSTQVLNAAPGCVLVAVIAPAFVSGHPADLIALALTAYAASRFSILPVMLFALAVTAAIRALLPA
ncbi:hypothetical protein SAMN02745962_04114 [Pseudomonas sp. LAIL14HWK12:I11]|nr:hypothetical protein SAMN02745962_04114 [Pseudomonas sp. LAIL14HWK12:I11]SMR73864.1 hypothetical protein SAMN05661028_01547 [Pseudomonas sp. LAIL14HWK12:I10]SOD05958.1 hypothetical protein SAMN05660296_04065 [Pseudomonas sp. LAIL14HWK12:I8]